MRAILKSAPDSRESPLWKCDSYDLQTSRCDLQTVSPGSSQFVSCESFQSPFMSSEDVAKDATPQETTSLLSRKGTGTYSELYDEAERYARQRRQLSVILMHSLWCQKV